MSRSTGIMELRDARLAQGREQKRVQCESMSNQQSHSTRGVRCSSDPLSLQEACVPNSFNPTAAIYSLFKLPCCSHCQEYLWMGERESLCCHKGKIRLDPLHASSTKLNDCIV